MFGYNNLVFDVRAIPIMKSFGYPVVIDASHSVQRPGGEGRCFGRRERIHSAHRPGRRRAGADGIFLEVHDEPSQALSDKDNSLKVRELKELVATLLRLKKAL